MKLGVVLAVPLALGACGREVDMYPIGPGTPGTGGTGTPDAAVFTDAFGDGGGTITAQVCLLSDVRAPTVCDTTGADGLMVSLGSSTTTTTTANGTFTIARPSGTNLVWRVTGPTMGTPAAIIDSAMPFSTELKIPVVGAQLYEDMTQANQAITNSTLGAIVAQVRSAGSPLSGATALATPAQQGSIFYDGQSPDVWDVNTTNGAGVVWVPNMQPGTAQLQITGPSEQGTISNIPVFANTVTFVLAEIP